MSLLGSVTDKVVSQICRTEVEGTYIAQANILNKRRVEVRPRVDLLHELVDNAIERRVLEAALLRLGEGSPDSERDDNVIRVLGGAASKFSSQSLQYLPKHSSDGP